MRTKMIQSELFEREKVHSEVHDTNSRGTPQWIIDEIRKVMPITFDLCASEWNRKAEKYYSLERGEDSLKLEWPRGNLWCNPPYSDIDPWVRKAIDYYTDWQYKNSRNLLMLLPARTERSWFSSLIDLHDQHLFEQRTFNVVAVKFLPFRINFDYPPGHEGGSSNPERSILVSLGIHRAHLDNIFQRLVNYKR